MSITVHTEKSHVADIIGAACTEIVEQEYRAGKFALTDGILVVDNGREFCMSLLDYSIARGTWKTAIFLIEQGCPIIPDVEGVCDDTQYAQFSTLGWATLHEEVFYYSEARDVACALIHHRHAEIDVFKSCAIGYDPYREAENIHGGLWIGRGSTRAPLAPRWPREKTSWNALEFAILMKRGALPDIMLRTQAVPSKVLWDAMLMCKDDRDESGYEVLMIHWVVAEQREKRALATAWACKRVPGNVWRDLTEILVPRVLAHTIRQQEDDGQDKNKKLKI